MKLIKSQIKIKLEKECKEMDNKLFETKTKQKKPNINFFKYGIFELPEVCGKPP